ncbi:MAG TPA: hypothetical protein VFQ91_12220 [Bryobacteraceae bacterium]|nr:hypothetical protein [Bryobacteraceae bacterium]
MLATRLLALPLTLAAVVTAGTPQRMIENDGHLPASLRRTRHHPLVRQVNRPAERQHQKRASFTPPKPARRNARYSSRIRPKSEKVAFGIPTAASMTYDPKRNRLSIPMNDWNAYTIVDLNTPPGSR